MGNGPRFDKDHVLGEADRSRGNGQSHVKFAALAVEAERIEASETHGTAEQEHKSQRQPPAGWQVGLIDDGRGHDAKGAGIDDGIELKSKHGVSSHDPGELTIHFVELLRPKR